MEPFVIGLIVITIVLVAIRMIIRQRTAGLYVEIFQTSSRTMSLPEAMTKRLKQEGIRYRIVFKGPPNQPIIGMSGEQFIALQAHVEDLVRARRIVSMLLNDAWRGR